MDLLTGMEFDLFVPSFPALQEHFHLTPSWVAALLSVNYIGYCMGLLFIGDLSDKFGRKPIILSGLIIFIIGSACCLWPLSYEFLLIGRFLQGLGIAAPAILSFLIIADAYPLNEQQVILGILNGAMNLAVGAAPVVGSYVTLYFQWQGNFAVLLIAAVLVLTMSTLFIIEQSRTYHQAADHLYGFHGYVSIFRSKSLFLLMMSLLLTFIPYWVFVGMSPLLYIKDLGVSLKHFGYYQGALAFCFGIGSILYGVILKHTHYSQKSMLTFGIGIIGFSILLISLATFKYNTNPFMITLGMLVFVISQIIPTTILYPICLNYLPHAKGRVSAMMQGIRLILTSLCLQAASYFYEGTFHNTGIIILAVIISALITLFFVSINLSRYTARIEA